MEELKSSAISLVKKLEDMDLYELNDCIKQINDFKPKIQEYFDLLTLWFRDVLYMKATNDVNNLIFRDEVYDIKKQATKRSYSAIETILQTIEQSRVRLNANVNFDLVIELLLLTIKENEKND